MIDRELLRICLFAVVFTYSFAYVFFRILTSLTSSDRQLQSPTHQVSAEDVGVIDVPDNDSLWWETRVKPPYSDKKFVYTVLTTRQFHGSRLKNIMRTWGQHVNIPFITTDALDPAFPTALVLGAEGKGDLGGKTLQALKKFCEFDSDFYVFTDDDSFVVAKNLESVIAANYDRDSALYAGYTLTHTVKPFVGGGGGIVFSNNTIKNFCVVAKSQKPPVECSWEHQRAAPGDMAISHCMNYLGVAATHQHGFYPFPITELMKERDNWCNVTWWIPKHLKCNPPVSRAISFHRVPPKDLRVLYFFTYLFASEPLEKTT